MSARLEPNELGAIGALLSAVDGVFRAVRGQDARLANGYQSLALALDRLAMTSHTLPDGVKPSKDDAEEAPPFDRAPWLAEIRQRLPNLSTYRSVDPIAKTAAEVSVTAADGAEDLLVVLEDLERFAHFARQDLLETALRTIVASRPRWRRRL